MTTLASRTVGDTGRHVVLLHGLFGQGKNFATLAGRLADSGHRATTVDLRNHGHSPWTPSQGYDDMAADVVDMLGPLGAPVVLVGHSMGGKTAMTVALRRPDLVGALVVVDVAPVDYASERPGSPFARYIAAMQAIDLATLRTRGAADAALAEAVPDAGVRGFLLQSLVRDGERWRWRLNLEALRGSLESLVRFPEPAPEARYDGPVLWIAGASSNYVRPQDRPRMDQLFPQTRLVRIKGAGHWVHAEQPAVFLDVLTRFVDALTPAHRT